MYASGAFICGELQKLSTLRRCCCATAVPIASEGSDRAAAGTSMRTRLGAAQLTASGPLLAKLVDGWLDDLERILGGLKEGDVDPRFVEGVLVEMKRS